MLARLAGSALVAAGVLGLAEGALAALGQPPEGLFDGDPGYHWSLRPRLDLTVPHLERGTTFELRTSELGLRSELPESPPWVLATGCSTTFGWGLSAEEAWPARVGDELGVHVVNAGTPGYSSAQGLRQLEALLPHGPAVVVLGWLVRDAQRSARSDAQARPTPWLQRTRVFRSLLGLLAAPTASSEVWDPSVGVARVPAEQYRENLLAAGRAVEAAGAVPLVLAFPMQREAEAHLAALEGLPWPVLRPVLPAGAFFDDDPIHLDASGHALLASYVAPAVRAALAR